MVHSATAPPRDRRLRAFWWAAFLFGVLSILLLLVGAWFLRTVPSDSSLRVTAEQSAAEPSRPPPAAPDPTPVLKASLDTLQADRTRLASQLAVLQGDLKRKVDQCQVAVAPPVEPPPPPPPPKPRPAPPPPPAPPKPAPQAAAPPPPPPPPPSPPAALPADRWANKDLGALQGCWNLGREAPTVVAGTVRGREECTTKVGRICFDANGQGTREQTISCPSKGTMVCRAPVTGQFAADGTFRTTQRDVTCDGGSRAEWVGRTMTCQRLGDSSASCRDNGRPELGYPAQDQEFRRGQ